MNAGLGQYDSEYRQCACFWGTAPGKFVKMLTSLLHNGKVLDLGAGEGKNAIFLASGGLEVIAVECSEYALNNFRRRLQTFGDDFSERLHIVQTDVNAFTPLANGELEAMYSGWIFHACENAVLEEVHPTTKALHKHSICRLLAQRGDQGKE